MDLRIIGIGIAITFAIIALSAVILYLTFRIKETFREEKGTKVQIAKIGFIIGILFLASGLFYFFAQALTQPDKLLNDTIVIDSDESQISGINNLTTLDLSYPDTVKTDEIYILNFIINNPSSRPVRNATIKLSGLDPFEVKSNFDVDINVLNLGDAQPGKRSGYIQLKAPSNPTTLEGELIFKSKDTNPLTRKIKITVNGNSIPSLLNPIIPALLNPKPTPTPDIWGRYYSPTVSTPNPPDTSTSDITNTSGITNTDGISNTSDFTNTSGISNTSDITNTTPAVTPSATPTPTATPTTAPTATQTAIPTATPTVAPTATQTAIPTATPTVAPTATQTATPTATPTVAPTATQTATPTATPTAASTATQTAIPTATPTAAPTATQTATPTATPTAAPTATQTATPTATQTATQTATPTSTLKLKKK